MSEPLAVAAVTFDFGNTLVRVDRAEFHGVIGDAAAEFHRRGVIRDQARFAAVWVEEQERQFREEVPLFREVDLDQRVVRVLARLRGMPAPPADRRWDDAAAARLSEPSEIAATVEWYSDAFVRLMQPVADATPTIEALGATGLILGILSNWPHAPTIERFAEAQGWTRHLRAIVVSQRVGTIKPHPSIFRAAEAALGIASTDRAAILHVGDDWAADVVGARDAGWRAAYLRDRQGDTPLPTSVPGDGVAPPGELHLGVPGGQRADLVVDRLSEIPPLVRRTAASTARAAGVPGT